MHLAEFGVKCPSCGVTFNSRQLPIILDGGERNSELRLSRGPSAAFEPHAVCTCPSCGLADWATAFRRVEEGATCVLSQPDQPAHLQYRAAALNAERRGKSFYSVAMFYLYAAWCGDDVGAHPQARQYRKLAIDAFKKSLLDGSCPRERQSAIQYLVGELMRRSGDFQGAREHFQGVIKFLPGKYALMARRIIRLADESNLAPIEFASQS